jgi:RNA-binding protein YlmH
MDDHELTKRRILELAERAEERGYPTHTAFIPLSEENILEELAMEGRANLKEGKVASANFFAYGGGEEAESKVFFFLPDFLDIESEKANEEAGETILCLHIEGKKAAYAEELSHRDYLGSLMSLGYEREQFGDILVKGKEAYVFLFKSIAEDVSKSLISVRHTSVKCTLLPPKDCPFTIQKEAKRINISSPRLDAVIAEVFSLSRLDAQRLIESGAVMVGSATVENNAAFLKGGELVAVRGEGKFLYQGEEKTSRKGRLFVSVLLYH